jgi:hypothetical protein
VVSVVVIGAMAFFLGFGIGAMARETGFKEEAKTICDSIK